ncbi:MAG TPA: hypothetical protein VKU85_07740 [bacterium]|nr:hypothetical protein [bacterium]
MTVRLIPLDGSPVEERSLSFRIDDLLVDVPAFGDAAVVSMRQRFVPDFVQYGPPPSGADANVALRAVVDGQTVTLDWDRNPAADAWRGSVAWIQRLPGAEWLACTTATTFTDRAPPGKHVYMVVWREDVRSATAVRGLNVAVVDVPDVRPAAPRIVVLRTDETGAVLWARSRPAADLRAHEWQRRIGERDWETVAGADGLLLRAAPEAGVEYRVRVQDAAGNASPFSEPVSARP